MSDSVLNILQKRYRTRSISGESIPDEIVRDLIEAIRLTPSCSNNQPWRFLFAETDEGREQLAEVFTGGNVAWAPRAGLIVVGYSRAEDDCRNRDGREYHQFDLGMATMNLMLAATQHDLVARPMAGFKPDRVRELFGLDEKDQPFVMVAIGRKGESEDHVPDHYKGIEDKARERKTADEIVRRV